MEDYKEFNYLKPLHDKHLEMLKDLDEFFSKHNIEWSLAYGSVLGALRHGGPIPWDDDVDIMMTLDNYNKFKSIFLEKGNKDKYYLQELGKVDDMINYAKIRLNNTTFIEDTYQKYDMHHGIFIDVFILHNVPLSTSKFKLGKFYSRYLQFKSMSNRGYKKRKLLLPLMWFLKLLPKKFGFRKCLKFFYKFDVNSSTEKIVWGMYNYTYKNEILFPFKRISYDDLMLPVPNDSSTYLTINYGEWNKIPNVKQINWAQHAQNWSVNKDFKSVMNNIATFKDEEKL